MTSRHNTRDGIGCIRQKLTPTQVEFIRVVGIVDKAERLAAGYQRRTKGVMQRLCQKFSMSPQHVKQIWGRKRWRHMRQGRVRL